MINPRHFIPLLLCIAFAAQGLWFIRTQSLTFDEPVHMVTGLDMWVSGKYVRWNDHPPLARALFAIPLLGKDWGIDFIYHPDDWNDHSPKRQMPGWSFNLLGFRSAQATKTRVSCPVVTSCGMQFNFE